MHSKIINIASHKNTEVSVDYSDFNYVKAINPGLDYIGDDLSRNKTFELFCEELQKIFPAFINVSEKGIIRVSKDSKEQFKVWFKAFIPKLRVWQDSNLNKFGFSTGFLTHCDVYTEPKNQNEWELIDLIFNICQDGENDFEGYLETISNLANYHEGENLYIVGSTDYHF